uniref:Uncharacterized protein n=1 Tax=viral metagenome TaxID=1070528 RepID=A0A6M3LQ82_9ZZZZ
MPKIENLKEVQIFIPPSLANEVKSLLAGQGVNLRDGYRTILEQWVREQKEKK